MGFCFGLFFLFLFLFLFFLFFLHGRFNGLWWSYCTPRVVFFTFFSCPKRDFSSLWRGVNFGKRKDHSFSCCFPVFKDKKKNISCLHKIANCSSFHTITKTSNGNRIIEPTNLKKKLSPLSLSLSSLSLFLFLFLSLLSLSHLSRCSRKSAPRSDQRINCRQQKMLHDCSLSHKITISQSTFVRMT